MTVHGMGPDGSLRLELHQRGRRSRLYIWTRRDLKVRGRMADPDYDPGVLAEVVPFPSRRLPQAPVSAGTGDAA